MLSSMFQRKKFSIRRNATKRWKTAVSGVSAVNKLQNGEPLSVIIKSTNMNLDQQKQAVEIANMALDTCGIESEIATFIKTKFDELTGIFGCLFVKALVQMQQLFPSSHNLLRLLVLLATLAYLSNALTTLVATFPAGGDGTAINKRRGGELFGKRSASLSSYSRPSRRTHELLGKRSDPEMDINGNNGEEERVDDFTNESPAMPETADSGTLLVIDSIPAGARFWRNRRSEATIPQEELTSDQVHKFLSDIYTKVRTRRAPRRGGELFG